MLIFYMLLESRALIFEINLFTFADQATMLDLIEMIFFLFNFSYKKEEISVNEDAN